LRIFAFIEDKLHYPVAITQVDENQTPEIAATMDPAHQQCRFPRIARAQLSTTVGPAQVAQ
jgi:hypothetical protein